MSTYTSSLGLELITPGSQAGLWGNTTNNTFTLIDQAITGVTPISFASASGSTYTLTDFNGAEDESRSAVLNITGSASGANTVVIPNKQKTYLVRNNTGQDVTFQTPSPTASYTVGAGYSILIFCDGNNNVFTGIASPGVGTLSVNAGGTGATTFTAGFIKSTGGTNALTSSATVNAATELTGAVPVANGGTGAVSLTSGAMLIGNGTGAVSSLSGGTAGYVATWNGSTWVSAAPASAGVTSVFSRTGAITAQSTDYSSYYLGLTATATNSSALGGVAASSYPTLSANNTWTGTTNTFNNDVVSGGNFYVNAGGRSTQVFNQGVRLGGVSGPGSGTALLGDGSALTVFDGSGFIYTATRTYFTIVPSLASKPGGGSWADSSDARLKENVAPLTGALDKLSLLNPVSYEWKYDRENIANVGFIAQEVESIFPHAVSEVPATDEQKPFIPDGENVKNIAWQNDMTAYLVAAIKELKAEVDALKAAK